MKPLSSSNGALAALTIAFAFSAAACSSDGSGSDRASLPEVMLSVAESGPGPNILVLHGGSGPATMTGIVAHYSQNAHVILPTYPGWDGTPRPDALDTMSVLADEYTRYLADNDLNNVLVIGNSMGGWLGAELAVRDTAHRLSGLVIIDGLGVNVEGQTITNITGMSLQQVAALSFHDPATFLANLPPSTPQSIARAQANAAATALFAGNPYGYDEALLARLKTVQIPTLFVWGDSDQIVKVDYGRGYAAAIPNADFHVVTDAGHLPWLEQPAQTFEIIDPFVTLHSSTP